MASSSDVRDIMGMEAGSASGSASGSGALTKAQILASFDRTGEKQKRRNAAMALKRQEAPKRPEGMSRELYNLLYNDSKDAPPIIPTDTTLGLDKGYKQLKAKLGMRKVRPWKWMPFTNPARRDGMVLFHWRRLADEGKEYPFAKFNRSIDVPSYSDLEYATHLADDGWSREETDHLIDLAMRFDLRFPVIQDRWDRERFRTQRSIEDLKERYYFLTEQMRELHINAGDVNSRSFGFDADHERRRKEQLNKLYHRTPEQIEEENLLKTELRKLEQQKKDRARKTQDLQKLISLADSTTTQQGQVHGSSANKGQNKKKKTSMGTSQGGSSGASKSGQQNKDAGTSDAGGIKWPSASTTPGVSLRSSRLKLPPTVGQRRSKALDPMLADIGVDASPPPTEEICNAFNELRSDLVLLYDLKTALCSCEQELVSLKATYEGLNKGKTLEIPQGLRKRTLGGSASQISDIIDVTSSGAATNSIRKRKAALEQATLLKKIKNKN